MSNFYELQAQKQNWNLASDEKMFEKVKDFQDNIIGSAHLIHGSMGELKKAINAANTTLHNSINAFSALNFNKFIENAVEETHVGEFDEESDEEDVPSTLFGAVSGPVAKYSMAIRIAYDEVSKKDKNDEDLEETRTQDVKTGKGKKLGVSKKIKLPFVIGTKEFNAHPFAGIKYLALDDSVELAEDFAQELAQQE